MATDEDRRRLGAWAVMMDPPTNIDRTKCHRTVPMQVLSLGHSRTGTLSMQEALKTLGYPTYHYSDIFGNPKDADVWLPTLKAKFKTHDPHYDYKKAFDQVLGDCAAVTDSPCVLLWRELVDAYPDAKVVLVDRDEQKWLKSFGILVDGCLNPFCLYFLRYADPFWFGKVVSVAQAWIGAFTGTTNRARAKQNALPAYRKHYADIRATVPKEKLLEFRLSDGWEPLCEFLGKEVPKGLPFPHRNEAQTLENAIGAAIGKSLKNVAFNLAVVVGVGAVVGGAIWNLGLPALGGINYGLFGRLSV